MTSISPTSLTTPRTTGADAATQTGQDPFGGLGPDSFLKLLVAQLRYQNPMSPQDPTAMMGQVAQFTQVEKLNQLAAAQTTVVGLGEAQLATQMIGKNVNFTVDENAQSATVTAARFTSTGPVLILDTGKEVPLKSVTGVTGADPEPASK